MCLPYLCVLGLLTVGCMAALQAISTDNPWYSLLFHYAEDVADAEREESSDASQIVPPTESEDGIRQDTFPKIKYRSVWAKLRVEGWSRYKEIPIYYGDSYDLLKRGAGMWQNSRFCGQNGKTVISAHVTTHFRELENTPVGTRLTMDTVYGEYVYEVTERIIFTPNEPELLYPADGEDTLVMYTCYPYNNGGRARTQRLALVCKKISGEVFAAYADR